MPHCSLYYIIRSYFFLYYKSYVDCPYFFRKVFRSSLIFKILLVGIVPMSITGIILNDFAGRGKPQLNTYIYAVNLVFSLCAYAILVYLWGITGAAWATVFSYCFLFAITTMMYVKVSGNNFLDLIAIRKSDFQILIFYIRNILKAALGKIFKRKI